MWARLNANERLAATGAVVVLVAWLVGVVTGYGFGVGSIPLLAAIALIVIYFLKYDPTRAINWPAPVPTIAVAVSGIAALLAVLALLEWLSFGFSFRGAVVAALASAVGTGIMAYGTWKEYQAQPKTPAA
jgi:hypothetical protein